jgi:DNA-binding NarL/FixJ family response regulator
MAPRPYRILIVDNHRIGRQGLRLLLEKCADFEIVGDTDDNKAVATAIAVNPDVILIDLRLPRFEETLRILSVLRVSVPNTRIIVLTVQGDEVDLVYHSIRNGAVGCILKSSSDIAEVEAAIRHVAEGQLFLSTTALQRLIDTIASRADISMDQSKAAKPNDLSPREDAVLELVALGYTNRQIADQLVIAESTVRSHLHNILEKLQLTNRVQAAAYAIQARPNGHAPETVRQSEYAVV